MRNGCVVRIQVSVMSDPVNAVVPDESNNGDHRGMMPGRYGRAFGRIRAGNTGSTLVAKPLLERSDNSAASDECQQSVVIEL